MPRAAREVQWRAPSVVDGRWGRAGGHQEQRGARVASARSLPPGHAARAPSEHSAAARKRPARAVGGEHTACRAVSSFSGSRPFTSAPSASSFLIASSLPPRAASQSSSMRASLSSRSAWVLGPSGGSVYALTYPTSYRFRLAADSSSRLPASPRFPSETQLAALVMLCPYAPCSPTHTSNNRPATPNDTKAFTPRRGADRLSPTLMSQLLHSIRFQPGP